MDKVKKFLTLFTVFSWSHVRMQRIDFPVPKKVICVLRAIGQMLIFGFGLFMIIYGAQFTQLASRNLMTGVGIKSSWLYVTCPIAGVAMCLMEIERFINCIDRIRRDRKTEGGVWRMASRRSCNG